MSSTAIICATVLVIFFTLVALTVWGAKRQERIAAQTIVDAERYLRGPADFDG